MIDDSDVPKVLSAEAVREWMQAKAVIVQFLREVNPHTPVTICESNAVALIARLAAHEPPLLIQAYTGEDA